MRARSGIDRVKERLLFAAALAAVAAYGGLWALCAVSGEGDASLLDPARQTYALPTGDRALGVAPEELFPAGDAWDDSVPRRWVRPRAAAPKVVVEAELDPPPATVPAPPALLPVPGPALEFTSGLPRWPGFPEAGGGEE